MLSNVAWTYLLHAYNKDHKIDYRYYAIKKTRKKFDKTRRGAYKTWELERCLNDDKNPIDKVSSANLRFLIGLRHEIEHQMTTRIDDYLSEQMTQLSEDLKSWLRDEISHQLSEQKNNR